MRDELETTMPTRRFLLAALAVLPAAAAAQGTNLQSPVGLWQTIDDHTGKPRGIVRVFESGGRLYGDVVQVLDPDKVGAACVKCTDDRKDKPVQGLQIIRGLAPDGDAWSGGTILDPETGSTYRCTVRVADGGRKLVVRGYLGISLLGRSQTWIRQG
jgi:uncharacterized protein (DUF2147 family)